ncbi:MAG: CocE/NonD family hydrolase [Chitinophagales bacterium]|nr:CocE/NonD family hydrolase [Chitinophagales bacterium]
MDNTSTSIRVTKNYLYHSEFIEMRDGVRLASDIFLPKNMRAPVPAILFLTRYVRTFEPKRILGFVGPIFGQVKKKEVAHYTKNGYAVVIVDVRGTGASYGTRKMEFSPQEVEDGKDILDWITQQSWSNGAVGTTGISYLGTTAEFILVNQHPALKACVVRSNIFDLYGDMIVPGGVRQGKFVEVWRDTTKSLDTNDFGYINPVLKLISRGPKMIGNPKEKKTVYDAAKEEHLENFDIFKGIFNIQFRDDIDPEVGMPVDTFSLHHYADKIAASKTPILRIGGWYDGGLANSVLKGFQLTENTHLAKIGPWDHGPAQNVSPFVRSNKLDYEVLDDIMAFFDKFLKEGSSEKPVEKKLQYYTFGAEVWKETNIWPPKNIVNQAWKLSKDHQLILDGSVKAFEYEHLINSNLGTGGGARWNSLTIKYRYKRKIAYTDRHIKAKQMINFMSEPLTESLTITGHPTVSIEVKSDATDLQLFAYLEEQLPNGKVRYITEGMIRGIHRKHYDENPFLLPIPYRTFAKADAQVWEKDTWYEIHFDLFAVSYQLQKGSRIKLGFAGADIDHFHHLDEQNSNPEKFHIRTDPMQVSVLNLPVEV